MKKHSKKLMALLAAVMLTAPVAAMSTQKASAVETKDAWTEYYRMGNSGNRSHPYSDAQSFVDISKKERKMIMDHFSSLFQGELVPWWEYAKMENVSALNNGTYTQEIFIPLTYTPKGARPGDFLNEEPKERLYNAMITAPGGPDEIANGHSAGAANAFDSGVETDTWKAPLRDISFTNGTKKTSTGYSTKPIGISIVRTVKNGADPLKPVKKQVVDMDATGGSAVTTYRYARVKKGKKHVNRLVKAGRIPSYTLVYVYGKKGNLYKLGKNRYAYVRDIGRGDDSVY